MKIFSLTIAALAALVALASCAGAPENAARTDFRLPYPIPDQLFSMLDNGADGRSQALAFVGREDLIAAEALRSERSAPPCPPSANAAAPVAEIVRRARETSVVIINESHDNPRHRAFAAKIAEALWDEGYRYFAAETFSPGFEPSPSDASAMNERNIADYESHEEFLYTYGWYSNEPVFADLVRSARARGYTLVAYDNVPTDENIDSAVAMERREAGQAENLVARIFRDHPQARAIIYAGGHHAREALLGPGGGVNTPMAYRLKAKTGIDPLTISQDACLTAGEADHLGAHPPHAEGFDLYVVHAQTTFERGRPVWRMEQGERPVDVPAALRSPDGPTIIEARRQGWSLAAAPVDRLMLWPGEDLPLLLAPGIYDFHSFTADGPYKELTDIDVE